MSPTPFAPDPAKWMSANKVDRSASKQQRPLIDQRFRAHVGISTPPPSTAKYPHRKSRSINTNDTPRGQASASSLSNQSSALTSASKKSGLKQHENVTPAKDGGMSAYFTPPISIRKDQNVVSRAKNPVSRLRVRADIQDSPIARVIKDETERDSGQRSASINIPIFPIQGPSQRRLRSSMSLSPSPPPPPSLPLTSVDTSKMDEDAAKLFEEIEKRRLVSTPQPNRTSRISEIIDISSPSPTKSPATGNGAALASRASSLVSSQIVHPRTITPSLIRPSNVIASSLRTSAGFVTKNTTTTATATATTRPIETPNLCAPLQQKDESSSYDRLKMTPVPPSVLRQHRRLCGHNSTRKHRSGATFKTDENADKKQAKIQADRKREEEKVKRREKIIEKEYVSNRVLSNTHEKVVLGKRHRSLVHLSSSSGSGTGDRSSSPHAPTRGSGQDEPTALPLGHLQSNVMPLRRYSSDVDPRNRKPISNDHEDFHPISRPFSPYRPFSLKKFDVSEDDVLPTPTKNAIHRLPPSSPPLVQHSPIPSPNTSTPRKQQSPHHKVTPPTFRSPRYGSFNQETLFELLPAPPPQPNFQSASVFKVQEEEEKVEKRDVWVPVEMEAETLLTWSLGMNPETLKETVPLQLSTKPATEGTHLDILSEGLDELPEKNATCDGMDLDLDLKAEHRKTPHSTKNKESSDDQTINSLSQTPQSQSFPHLIDSSPSKNAPQPQAAPSPSRHVAFASPTPNFSPYKKLETTNNEDCNNDNVNVEGDGDNKEIVLVTETLGSGLRSKSIPNLVYQGKGFIPKTVVKLPAKKLIRRAGKQKSAEKKTLTFDHTSSSLSDELFPVAQPLSDSRQARRQAATNRVSQSRPSPSQNRKSIRSSSQRRKRSYAERGMIKDSNQSKLEMFGYFPEREGRESRGFDAEFEDEEDLHFDDFEPDVEGQDENESEPKRHKSSLGPVPAPPPHPSLRAAGIRELGRREKVSKLSLDEREQHSHRTGLIMPPSTSSLSSLRSRRFTSKTAESSSPSKGLYIPPSSSIDETTDMSSSLATIEGGIFKQDEEAREWWDAIDKRHSDEFDSLS